MRMLYRVPGKHKLHGIQCDYRIVPDTSAAIAEAEGQGWYLSPTLALEASQKPPEPVAPLVVEQTRDDLVKLAESLGIKVDGRWSIARLRQEIDRVDEDE